jgi:FixJ family two-component response regulator
MGITSASVFIVDDDVSFGRSLKRLLNARGISADCFRSAQSFLDSVLPGQHGYAIVDIHMPGCDGLELMSKMREMRYRIPVIIITVQPKTESRDTALQKGALGFLQKPFSEESLLDLIEKHETNGAT